MPVYGVWDQAADIEWDALPGQFVLKANHGSGFFRVVTDKERLDRAETLSEVERWLGTDYSTVNREKQYRRIPPKVLAERYLGESVPLDFNCFWGHPWFIDVPGTLPGWNPTPRPHQRLWAAMDEEWNQLPMAMEGLPMSPPKWERPANLDLMWELAGRLSTPFPHVRVDLYSVEGSVYFSELTFVPDAGFVAWGPRGMDRRFGDLVQFG